jgi:hypothetical protein
MKLSILTQEKIPYFLTILFAILGWNLTHLVNRLEASPVIEYSYKYNINSHDILYTVRNISINTNFKDISFYIILDDKKPGRCDGEPSFYIYPPLHLGSPGLKPKCVDGLYSCFHMNDFQPKSKVQLLLKTNAESSSTLRITCDDPVYLIESSVQTFLLNNEQSLLLALIIVWCVCIVAFICMTRFCVQSDDSQEV